MEHRNDLQTLGAHSVRNDVRCAWHDHFPGARDAAIRTEMNEMLDGSL